MASRGSYSLDSDSCVGVGTIDVATLGVGLSALCLLATCVSSSIHSVSCVGVRPTGVATLGVDTMCHKARCRLPASWHVAYRGPSSLYSEYCVGAGTKGVATLSLVLQVSCRITLRCTSSVLMSACGRYASRRDARRRLVNFVSFGALTFNDRLYCASKHTFGLFRKGSSSNISVTIFMDLIRKSSHKD